MSNQRTVIRPTGATVPTGVSTRSSTNIQNANSTADAQFNIAYNRMADGGKSQLGVVLGGETDFRNGGTNFAAYLGARVTAADGNTTINTNTVTSATGRFTASDIGSPISGTNIPAGSHITGVTSTTSIAISQNATATGTTSTLTIGDTTAGTPARGDTVFLPWSATKSGTGYYYNVSFSGFSLPTNAVLKGVHAELLGTIIKDTNEPYESDPTEQLITPIAVTVVDKTSTKITWPLASKTFTPSNGLTAATASNTPSRLIAPTTTQVQDSTSGKAVTRAATITDIGNLRVTISSPPPNYATAETRQYQLWVYVDWNMAPNAQSVALSNTNSTSPTVTWTYLDPEGDAQKTYRVRVFKQSDTQVAGFDPNNSATWPANSPTYDSGLQTGSVSAFTIPAGNLRGGTTYRAFVYVTDTGSTNGNTVANSGSGGQTNSYNGSTINVTALSNTTLTLTSSTANFAASGTAVFQTDRGWATISYTGISGSTLTGCNLVGGTGFLVSGSASPVYQDQGIDFTPTTDPMLAPWLNYTTPSNYLASVNSGTGALGPLYLHPRLNALSQYDAAIEYNGAANQGGWTATGTSSFTTTTTTAHIFRGTAALAATASGASIVATSGAAPVTGGVIYTGSIKACGTASGGGALAARRPITCQINFYSDAAGTALINSVVSATQQIELAANTYVTVWTYALAPTNAVSAKLVCTITSASTEIYYLDAAGITAWCNNVCDDGGFGNGPPSGSIGAFWKSNAGAGNSISYDDDGFTDTYFANNGGLYVPSDSVGKAITLTCGTSANACDIRTWADVGWQGSKWLVSGYAKRTDSAVAAGSLTVGFQANVGVSITTTVTAGNTSGGWARFSATIDASAMASTTSGVFILDAHGFGTQTIRVDGITFERIWTFAHGGFENNASGAVSTNGASIVNQAVSLGETNDWVADTGGGSSAVIWDNSGAQAGTFAAKMTASGTNISANLYQFFTCSGYTSVTFGAWAKGTGILAGQAGIFVDWYDLGGVKLTTTTLATVGTGTTAWTNVVNAVVVTVPTGAAYARIRATNTDTNGSGPILFIDTVTVALTGSIAPAPYTDGGWSAGVGLASMYFYVQRATTQTSGTTWTTVRYNQDSLTNSVSGTYTAIAGQELAYTDYEWTPSPVQAVSDNFYRAYVWTNATTSIPPSAQSPTSLYLNVHGIMTTTSWLLIDPTKISANLALSIKPDGVKIETPETLQEFVALGRPRKVVIADTVLGDTLTLSLLTVTPGDFTTLMTQLLKQTTLYLQSPDGESWYVRATKRQRSRTWTGSYTQRALRNYDITFEEVDTTS